MTHGGNALKLFNDVIGCTFAVFLKKIPGSYKGDLLSCDSNETSAIYFISKNKSS